MREENVAGWLNGRTAVLLRACIIAVIVFPMVLASLGAAAQDNLSSQIETSIEALANENPEVRRRAASALGRIEPAAEQTMPS
jgi:HEAT repeat protein